MPLYTLEGRRKKTSYFDKFDISNFYKKPKNVCWVCGKSDNSLHRDHLKSLSLGGKDELSNLQLICKKCRDIKTLTEKFSHIRHQKKPEVKRKELWEYV